MQKLALNITARAFFVCPAAHVSNWCKPRIRPARGALCRMRKIVKKTSNRHISALEFQKCGCIMKAKKRESKANEENGRFEK